MVTGLDDISKESCDWKKYLGDTTDSMMLCISDNIGQLMTGSMWY
jgi:hypothetical protein